MQIQIKRSPKKKKSSAKKLFYIDSFSKGLIYANFVCMLIAFIWSLVLCTLNQIDPSMIFTEMADCWKKTFPLYLGKSTIENVNQGVIRYLDGRLERMDNYGICSERDSVDSSSDGLSRAPEDNRS